MLKLLSIPQNKIQTEDHYIINNELDDLLNKELVELFLNANNCIDDENFLEAIEFYDLILKIDPKNIFPFHNWDQKPYKHVSTKVHQETNPA